MLAMRSTLVTVLRANTKTTRTSTTCVGMNMILASQQKGTSLPLVKLTVRSSAARAGLESATRNHILTPEQLFDWATSAISGTTMQYDAASDVELNHQI